LHSVPPGKSLDGRQHYEGRTVCAMPARRTSYRRVFAQGDWRSAWSSFPSDDSHLYQVERGKLALVPDVDVSRLKEFLRSQTCTPYSGLGAERASVLREVSDFKLGAFDETLMQRSKNSYSTSVLLQPVHRISQYSEAFLRQTGNL